MGVIVGGVATRIVGRKIKEVSKVKDKTKFDGLV